MWVRPLTKGHRAALSARLKEHPPDERRPMVGRARRAAARDWRMYVPLGVAVIAGAAAMFFAPVSSGQWSLVRGWIAIAMLIGGFAAMVWSDVLQRRLVQKNLATQFPTLCPACGYDRRATPARCPECGTESHAARTD